jgi:hypothetical protein
LFICFLIYDNFGHITRNFPFIVKLSLFSALFWFGLILVEWTAYNIFELKNIATKSYEGIPFLNCIHAPLWMKVSYFSIGPLYYISLEFFRSVFYLSPQKAQNI